MKVPCIVIGGGLSGIAAAIRIARFVPEVLLIEQHSRFGGLNSYFYRNKTLFETGLHAITNYSGPKDKKAPLNRLFRQLKLKRDNFNFLEQKTSEIAFGQGHSLLFSNDFSLLRSEIKHKFSDSLKGFDELCRFLGSYDPFTINRFVSARNFLATVIPDPLLIEMLLCPLMYYGSSVEDDMDLSQFAIMFQAIFQEGMFRPEGTIRDLLDTLVSHYTSLGGTIQLGQRVTSIEHQGGRARGIVLANGDYLQSQFILSTIGFRETLSLLGTDEATDDEQRLGFIESIFQLKTSDTEHLPADRTIIFYNNSEKFRYQSPADYADYDSGVICFPANFTGRSPGVYTEVRSTHLASYPHWSLLAKQRERYLEQKAAVRQHSRAEIEKIIGDMGQNVVYEDTFTPLTIERYTAKKHGAIYGSPDKIKDGDLGFDNLFLAGTDQGFLGIVGSMLSGVSIVNQQILSRL